MAAERSQTEYPTATASLEGERVALQKALVAVAERELERALREQTQPMMGLYVHPSNADNASLYRAVRAVCAESHRLGLRAEELIIGLKHAWVQLAPARARHLGDRDGDVLREIVSSSIEVFFEARGVPAQECLD